MKRNKNEVTRSVITVNGGLYGLWTGEVVWRELLWRRVTRAGVCQWS